MSSLRDKLKEANKQNALTRGNTSTNDTIFGDFANRHEQEQETNQNIKESKKIYTNDINNTKSTNSANTTIYTNDTINTIRIKDENCTNNYVAEYVSMTLILNENTNKLITQVARMNRIAIKQLFEDIMAECIKKDYEQNSDIENYREVQHGKVRRVVPVRKDLKNDITIKAAALGLRTTSFISFCLDEYFSSY
ncbi:hypothetical protein [Lachnospira multipara]|uniref:Uncharacterized protein n=1 Tax=Lachnospira multipara TaxID=28051 RepID=A0A1H5VNJ5_9FIRM|nr:hypothetical protein [Lachnospira multipara]SEF88892.1 hypothetical protein SAMN05216537_1121 [Lachnospira multipara]